jgi:hypothetical protein
VDSAAVQDLVPSLALGIGLAACAGLRAWLPLLLTGLLARFDYLTLGPAFQFLTTNRALVLFGAATLIEFVGDKFPAVDHALDAIGTVLRPVAGALLAASVLWEVQDPLVAVALGVVVGAPSALVPHAAKSALRAVSTTLTAGIANPLLSLLEDAIAIGLFVLAILVPLLVALLVACSALLLLRWFRNRARTQAPPPAPLPTASA